MKMKVMAVLMALLMFFGAIPTLAEGTAEFVKYDPPLQLEIVMPLDSTVTQELADIEGTTGETMEANRWTNAWKDTLGIEVSYRWAANPGEYDQRLRLEMAANDLPDIFVCNSQADIKQMADAGVIQPLGDVFEAYKTPLTESILYGAGDTPFKMATVNGELYAIPRVMPSTDPYQYCWVRGDWIEKLGAKIPETMDEYIDLLYKASEADFDGNGVKDTTGLIAYQNVASLKGFFWSYGAYPDMWIEKDGALVYGATQPEMKQALAKLQKLYADGILDREFGTMTSEKAYEAANASRAFSLYDGHWIGFTIIGTLENDPEADWIAIPHPTATGAPVAGVIDPSCEGFICVSSKCENPEAAIMLFNLFFENCYGETGDYEYWAMATDNAWKWQPFYAMNPRNNLDARLEINAVLRGEKDASELVGVPKSYYANFSKDGAWAWESMFGLGQTPFKVMDEDVLPNDLLKYNGYLGSPTDTMVEYESTLDELRDDMILQIIIGGEDVDTAFDKFVKSWNALGGETITEEVNAWYATAVK